MSKNNRNTIKVVDCKILAHQQFKDNQFILTLASGYIAKTTKPGQFVHVSVSDMLLMRRPISIMSTDVKNSSFDLLYKIVGEGTQQLSCQKVGAVLSVIGPIGKGFTLINNKQSLLIGGGVGIPPIIALAQQIKQSNHQAFAILGSESPFPFTQKPAVNGKNYQGATHTMPILEDWNIECRLASLQHYVGVYQGYVTDLAHVYLDGLSTKARAQMMVYACGPHPMLVAVANLAKTYNIPCQVSLEEYMACAVGGCAGCVVKVQTSKGPMMQRVCVDGPVFAADTIF